MEYHRKEDTVEAAQLEEVAMAAAKGGAAAVVVMVEVD